jgi:hypothetical protein
MINKVIDGIIQSVISSVIFNLWLGDQPSSPPPSILFLPYVFFLQQTATPQPNLNTIQPPITNLTTTTLSSYAIMFWFKFYWGFFTLSKQIYHFFLFEPNFKMLVFLHIVLEYVYFVWVFTCFIVFPYKFIVWIYDLYMLGFVLNFIKIYLFVNWWDICQIFYLDVLWWNK